MPPRSSDLSIGSRDAIVEVVEPPDTLKGRSDRGDQLRRRSTNLVLNRQRDPTTMKRYAVIDHSLGLTQGVYDELSEAIASAVKLQDAGRHVGVHDTQGSAALAAGFFDVRDAEAYLGRGIGSESISHPIPIEQVLAKAEETKPDQHKYHWDLGD